MPKITKMKNKVESSCINFPVGYIYISAVEINPGEYFGGTWEQIKDKFLLMAGDTYSAGTTGGTEKNTLTYWNMPSGVMWNQTGSIHVGGTGQGTISSKTDAPSPINNMPPYLTVYGYMKTA